MTDSGAWRTLSRQVVFAGGPIREIAIEAVELPDGTVLPDYYTIALPDYVLVFLEMRDGTVPLLRQYKHGLRRTCLAFPGGAIDNAESAIAAAQREILEELGCVADAWHSFGAFVTNANQGCNRAHLFRATGGRRVTEPRAPDLERPQVEYFERGSLLEQTRLSEIGLVSHVALLLLATQPQAPVLARG